MPVPRFIISNTVMKRGRTIGSARAGPQHGVRGEQCAVILRGKPRKPDMQGIWNHSRLLDPVIIIRIE